MAERFLVTGVQLGMLKSLMKYSLSEARDLINDIISTQNVGYSTNDVKDDVQKIKEINIWK